MRHKHGNLALLCPHRTRSTPTDDKSCLRQHYANIQEYIHRKSFVFRSIFVYYPLHNAYHLKFRYARFKHLYYLVRRKLYYAETFPYAGKCVLAFYTAKFYHYVVAPYYLRVREIISQSVDDRKSALDVTAETYLYVFSRNADVAECVFKCIRHKFRIIRIC